MKLRKAAVSALLSLLLLAQTALPVTAAEAQIPDTPQAAETTEDIDTAEDGDTAPDLELSAAETAGNSGLAYLNAEVGRQKEEEYLGKNPELAELGDYVFEGDTLPCSENDPSYHKYISALMQQRDMAAPSLDAALGARIVTSYVYNSENLVHQARFASCRKTYGIDVSYYQGNIDWAKVKAEGFSFAILRVGYRGYGSAGTLVLDDKFQSYLVGAKAAGLDVGVYFYTQAITVAEAREEADFVYKYIKGTKLELPVYFDMETVENAVGRLDAAGLTKAQKTEINKAFCERIKSYGYAPGIYTNISWYTYWLNGEELSQLYPIWLANYTMQTKFEGPFDIWQYGYGTVNGISGYADLNVKYDISEPPAAVEGLSVSGTVSTTAKLSWKASAGSTSYDVFRVASSGDVIVKTVSGTSTTIDLTSGFSTYYVRGYYLVNANKIYGDPSNQVKLKQSAPTAPSQISQTTTSIQLTWNAVADADEYTVQIYNESTGKYYNHSRVKTNTCNVTGLTAGTKYKARIRCYYYEDDGTTTTGSYGAETIIATQLAAVAAPAFVTKTDTSITISWDKAAGAEGYQVVYYSSAAGKYVELARTTATKATLSGLSKGTIYFFKISAYHSADAGCILGEYSEGLLCATRCEAPASFTCTSDDSAGTATFKWSACSGANGYRLYVSKNGAEAQPLAETDSLTATVSGLGKGVYTAYLRPYIKLDGVRYYGNSSAETGFVIGKAAPVVKVSASTPRTVTVKWAAVDGAYQYHTYVYNTETLVYNRKGTLDSSILTYTFTDLEPDTDYTFKVRTYYKNGEYKYSAAVKVHTPQLTRNDIGNCKVSIPYASYTYRGYAIEPAVTVKDGSTKLTLDKDYTLKYENNLNAGTATITVTGTGEYTGTYKKTFTVKPLDVSTSYAKVTIPYASYTYTGFLIKPEATLRFKDGTAIPKSDYSVSYSKNRAVGLANITVYPAGKNVTGSFTRTFVIKPEKNTITYLSSGKSGVFTLSWKKGTAGTTGYQVLYSTTSDFSANVHSWTTTDTTKLGENFSSVPKSGETWYVKVRSFYTANGTRYGNYSAVKKIKVK
ncbi:MAG: fibronectin type III domain-containing protein [Ruminococcus sp.]|nr:fibronectin type III domain-containing protein [Ruminococcus sp.]